MCVYLCLCVYVHTCVSNSYVCMWYQCSCVFTNTSSLKVGLKPTDPVRVYYQTVKSDKGSEQAVRELDDIISRQVEYITSSIKLSFEKKQGDFSSPVVGKDLQKVNCYKLT